MIRPYYVTLSCTTPACDVIGRGAGFGMILVDAYDASDAVEQVKTAFFGLVRRSSATEHMRPHVECVLPATTPSRMSRWDYMPDEHERHRCARDQFVRDLDAIIFGRREVMGDDPAEEKHEHTNQ